MAASGTLLFQRGGVREMTETKHKLINLTAVGRLYYFFYVTFNIF